MHIKFSLLVLPSAEIDNYHASTGEGSALGEREREFLGDHVVRGACVGSLIFHLGKK